MTFEFLSLEELLCRPPKRWLFDNLIGFSDLVMIYGTPWSGKTLVTIDLIMSYITQSQFSCFKTNLDDHPRSVLYCTDEGIDGLSARFNASLSKYGNEVDINRIKISLSLPNLYSPRHKLSVDVFIKDLKKACPGPFSPRLIILDTLKNSTIGSSENSNDDAAIIAAAAKRIKAEFDCTVIFIHHSDKSGKWMRGASAFMGDMDCIIKIEAGKLIIEKVKDYGTHPDQAFRIVEMNGTQSVVVDWLGEYKDSGDRYLEFLKTNSPKRFTAKEIAEALELAQPNVIRDMKKLASENGVVFSELTRADKTQSKYNPMLYWYSDNIFGI